MSNSIVIDSFQGGLANDKNSGPKGAFWDAQGIEIRKNSEYVTLNRGVTETFAGVSSTGTGVSSPIVAITTTNYKETNSNNAISDLIGELNTFTNAGKIYENLTGEIGDVGDTIRNVFNTGGYNYILGASTLYRFQNAVRENVLATDTFASGWTGTNWSAGTHTPGSTVAYTQSSPLVTIIGERYHIIIQADSQSAGSCTVTIGGAAAQTITNFILGNSRNDLYFTATSTAGISFTPSSDSTIVLSYVRVDRVSDLASSNGLGIKTIGSLTASVVRRPVINFYGDLIIGDGNQIARYNRDGTIILFSSTVGGPVIGGLDGTVYAITAIGTNIYVWCNNGGATNMYLWDGVSERPSQKVTYPDKPVINVALLNNQHYWWTEKGSQSIKSVMVGTGYEVQRYITSDIPKSETVVTLDDPDRLALYNTDSSSTNAIETYGDIVYMPGYGKIYGFGNYFPGQSKAFNKEFTFDGTECTAMLTPTFGGNGATKDFTPYMMIAYKRGSLYYVGIIDFRDYNGSYVSDGYLETMEYLGGNLGIEKNQKKLLVPFYLPDDSTSIEVYERKNQASSYTLIKTINTTDYGTGFNVAEIADSGKWNTIQWKFKLITSDSTYSPRLYVGVTDILLDTANRNG